MDETNSWLHITQDVENQEYNENEEELERLLFEKWDYFDDKREELIELDSRDIFGKTRIFNKDNVEEIKKERSWIENKIRNRREKVCKLEEEFVKAAREVIKVKRKLELIDREFGIEKGEMGLTARELTRLLNYVLNNKQWNKFKLV